MTTILGEALQVIAFLQASNVMTAGIILDGWNLELSTANYLLVSCVTIALLLAPLVSLYHRIQKLRYGWPAIIGNTNEAGTTETE